MEINLGKTNVMTVSGTRELEVKLPGKKQVKEFVFLGSPLTDERLQNENGRSTFG